MNTLCTQMKNSVYTSSPAIYCGTIEDKSGVAQFTKNFDTFQNACDWCVGMTSDEGYAFKVSDIDTKRILKSGRNLKGEIVPYDVPAETEKPLTIVGAAPIVPKGIEKELEHRDLIVKMLTEAGQEATEAKIMSIAEEIARVHEKENPHYYDIAERVGL